MEHPVLYGSNRNTRNINKILELLVLTKLDCSLSRTTTSNSIKWYLNFCGARSQWRKPNIHFSLINPRSSYMSTRVKEKIDKVQFLMRTLTLLATLSIRKYDNFIIFYNLGKSGQVSDSIFSPQDWDKDFFLTRFHICIFLSFCTHKWLIRLIILFSRLAKFIYSSLYIKRAYG